MQVDMPVGLVADLDARWNEPHRRHHDARHRDEMLSALDVLAEAGEEFDVRPVVLATWFHDAVYEVFGEDNEGASARLAADLLGADDPDVTEVVRLVELTRTHDPSSDDRNGGVLSDADLWILGADPARYREYVDAVRDEYQAVPDDLFRSGRAQLLRDLLSHDHLYVTATARRLWEADARRNVAAEIVELTSG
ncbi:HD domain-containing protein [Gordonia sp. NPDC003950]